jgi:hypothetical protein
MHKTVAMLALLALVSSGAAAKAAIINLDGIANSSTDGSNAVSVLLGPGTYDVAPVIGSYTAFNPFSAVADCDPSGANCAKGWNWRLRTVADQPIILDPGFDFPVPGQYFATEALAFANAPGLGKFTLTTATTMKFWIPDAIFFLDNDGGVSFSLTAVPEPASWALMIGGFGLTGAVLRRRRRGGLAA